MPDVKDKIKEEKNFILEIPAGSKVELWIVHPDGTKDLYSDNNPKIEADLVVNYKIKTA